MMKIQQKRSAGYTLIEILITIAIIGALAGIAYPIIIRALITGKETEAKNLMKDLHNSIDLYLKDNHGIVPRDESSSTEVITDDWLVRLDSDAENGGALIRTLTAKKKDSEERYNMRNKVYFDAKEARDGENGITYSNGFPSGLVDPWGHGYVVFLDMNGDNIVDTGSVTIEANSYIHIEKPKVNGSCFIASKGHGDEIWENELYSVIFE